MYHGVGLESYLSVSGTLLDTDQIDKGTSFHKVAAGAASFC
jgi:hypothetical protein